MNKTDRELIFPTVPAGYVLVDEPVAGDFAECNGVLTKLTIVGEEDEFACVGIASGPDAGDPWTDAYELHRLGLRFLRPIPEPTPEPEWELLPSGTEPEEDDQADFNGKRFDVIINREGDLCVKVPCEWADSVCTIEFAKRINAKFYRRTPAPKPAREAVQDIFAPFKGTVKIREGDHCVAVPVAWPKDTEVLVTVTRKSGEGE